MPLFLISGIICIDNIFLTSSRRDSTLRDRMRLNIIDRGFVLPFAEERLSLMHLPTRLFPLFGLMVAPQNDTGTLTDLFSTGISYYCNTKREKRML